MLQFIFVELCARAIALIGFAPQFASIELVVASLYYFTHTVHEISDQVFETPALQRSIFLEMFMANSCIRIETWTFLSCSRIESKSVILPHRVLFICNSLNILNISRYSRLNLLREIYYYYIISYGKCRNTLRNYFVQVFRIVCVSRVSVYPDSSGLEEDADKGISMATIDPAALPTDSPLSF